MRVESSAPSGLSCQRIAARHKPPAAMMRQVIRVLVSESSLMYATNLSYLRYFHVFSLSISFSFVFFLSFLLALPLRFNFCITHRREIQFLQYAPKTEDPHSSHPLRLVGMHSTRLLHLVTLKWDQTLSIYATMRVGKGSSTVRTGTNGDMTSHLHLHRQNFVSIFKPLHPFLHALSQ